MKIKKNGDIVAYILTPRGHPYANVVQKHPNPPVMAYSFPWLARRVAFHDHPLFVDEDRLSASLRLLFGRYRAKMETENELYLRRRLSASLSVLLGLRSLLDSGYDGRRGERAGGVHYNLCCFQGSTAAIFS